MVDRMVFVLTTGRSGTKYLATVLDTIPGVAARHEPAPDFAHVTRDAVTYPNFANFFWNDVKLPAIDIISASIYVETNHGFKYFARAAGTMPVEDLDLIVLTRPDREVAISYWHKGHYPGRNKGGLRYFIKPNDPLSFIQLAPEIWQTWTDYQMCYWYCLETALRVSALAQLRADKGGRIVEIAMREMITRSGFERLVEELELPAPDWHAYEQIAHTKINASPPGYTLEPYSIEEQEAEVRDECERVAQ